MNSKNGAEWLRASLCPKKGKAGRKSLAKCDAMRNTEVTKRVSTRKVTCQDVLLSSGGTSISNDGQGSRFAEVNQGYGVGSRVRVVRAEVAA